MPNTSNYIPSRRILAVAYGKSGVGKTWGALTFPRPNILDFDKGISVSKNPAFTAKHGQINVEYEQFREKHFTPKGTLASHNAFDDACRYFDECMKPAGKWLASDGQTYEVGRDRFDTWVVDTGTTLAMAARNKAIILLGTREFKEMSQTHKQATSTGLVYPKMQDYGAERSLVEQFVDMLKDTDKHVIFLCHQKETTDSSGNITGIVPLLTGASTEAVPLRFEDVWYLDVKRDGMAFKRSLITEMDGIHQCKSRLGIPSGTEWNYAAIKAQLDANTIPQAAAK